MRRSLLLVSTMALALIVASGVALALPSETPDQTPMVNGTVRDIEQVGTNIWVGGKFTQVKQRNGLGGSIGRGFTRKFIADSSALARVLMGWVYLLSSSSYSLLELLVGFPMAHPLLLSPYSPECVEVEFLELRCRVLCPSL